MSKEKEIEDWVTEIKPEEMNWKKNWIYGEYVPYDDVDYQKYKENLMRESKKLLDDIAKWTGLLVGNDECHYYDIGVLQNYAWELNESYKKLSKLLQVKNLIS